MSIAVTTTADRRGRGPTGETVAETVEGWQYEQLVELTHAQANREPYWLHDGAEDATRREIRRLADLLRSDDLTRRAAHAIAAEIVRWCDEADRCDALADARAVAVFGHVSMAQQFGRSVTGWIEHITSGRQRNRPERRPVPATQLGLEIDG